MDDPLMPPLTIAAPGTVTYRAIPGGFLRLAYGKDGGIANVAATRTASADAVAVGLELHFLRGVIDADGPVGDGQITCKTAMGLGGQVFSDGVVRHATVYDDDGPSDPGRPIGKEAWLRECLQKMAAGLLAS